MASIAYCICILFTLLQQTLSTETIYRYETWMSSFPSTVNLYHNTIFDIILPGSRSSGMIHSEISTKPSNTINNNFDYSLIESLSRKNQKLWSQRQKLSILNQLRYGARFLDLQIEQKHNNNFYTYNGLLGANIHTIINDINTFITNYGPEEIIVIYLNRFYGSDFETLYNIFNTSNISTKTVPNTIDLKTMTLQNMINNHYNIIIFSDILPNINHSTNIFFNSKEYIHTQNISLINNFTLGSINTVDDMRTFVISNIINGWPKNKLNLIYWSVDITNNNPFYNFDSFYEYNIPLSFELNKIITSFNKLRFGNVLLVDFISSSDVIEQSIILNHEYSICKDTIWHDKYNGCPALTSLSNYFKYDNPSPCNKIPNLQILCPRSCGVCNMQVNNPGSNCKTSICNSDLYKSFSDTDIGKCYHSNEESFCLGLNTYSSCIDIDECDHLCSANYQCSDGFCHGKYSICMNRELNMNTTNININTNKFEKYDRFISKYAMRYRSEIKLFRPGDPDGDYDDDIECNDYSVECFFENMNENDYSNSVLGLLFVIIICTISICCCFSICCPIWCLCDNWCKELYCKPIYGNEEKEYWSPVKQYGAPCCLITVLIIVLAFAIQGIEANAILYSNIFGESDSFRSVSDMLFNDVDKRFGSVNNFTDIIIDNIQNITNYMDEIIYNNGSLNMEETINKMDNILNILSVNYSNGLSLNGEVINPFDNSITEYRLHCVYCDSISNYISNVNQTLETKINIGWKQIMQILNTTQLFINSSDLIYDSIIDFRNSIDKILDISNNTNTKSFNYMLTIERYDAIRQIYITLIFCVVFIFIINTIIGFILSSEWCFKIIWCLAMFYIVMTLIIAIPFVFATTLGGDFCVSLDEFEIELPSMNSKLGRAVFNNYENNNNNNNKTLSVIEECFNGGSALNIYNLYELLNWTVYKYEINNIIQIDSRQYFQINDLEFLETEINTLSLENEYLNTVNQYIYSLNSINKCFCGNNKLKFNKNNNKENNGDNVNAKESNL
eukprot:327947_1